jgi:hypothetical protein
VFGCAIVRICVCLAVVLPGQGRMSTSRLLRYGDLLVIKKNVCLGSFTKEDCRKLTTLRALIRNEIWSIASTCRSDLWLERISSVPSLLVRSSTVPALSLSPTKG